MVDLPRLFTPLESPIHENGWGEYNPNPPFLGRVAWLTPLEIPARDWANAFSILSLTGLKPPSFLTGFTKTRKIDGKGFLALDIGTESVKALVFVINKDGVKIVGVGKESQKAGDVQGGMITDPESVESSCQRAIARARGMAGIKASRVVIGTGGGFIKGLATTFHFPREHPFEKINVVELKNIFQKLQWKVVEKARAVFLQEGGFPETGIKVIDGVVQEIKVDGYAITDPIGLQGKRATFDVFHTYLPSTSSQMLEDMARNLNLEIFSVFQESYAVFQSISKESLPDAILIDVGGGSTEVSLIRKKVITGIKEFSLGGRVLTQRVSQELGVGFWEAEDIKIKFSEGELSPSVSRKIQKILEKDLSIWISGLEITLKELSLFNILPYKIFVYGGGSRLPQLQQLLQETKWFKDLPFSRDPEINLISSQDIKGVEDLTKKLQSAEDVVPVALVSTTFKSQGQSDLQEILRKIMRISQK